MVALFYPYLQRASAWEELRYSLRSAQMYLQFDFQVWIIGDLPEWIQGVNHIAHIRSEHIHAPTTFDAVSKLQAYLDHSATPETFVRMYDDVYFLAPRTLGQMQITRYLFDYAQTCRGEFRSGSMIWRDQVIRSVQATRKAGMMGIMTETHCPEVFLKERMKEIIYRFDPRENRLLTSTLYFNSFPYESFLYDRKTERALFYGYHNEFSYSTDALVSDDWSVGKFYLNHNDAGLDQNLKRFIQGKFPYPSRFEK